MAENFRKKYEPMARAAAIRHGVDPDIFVEQINKESSFNPKASSGAAHGIAQFKPETAKSFGIDPYNPEQALDAGARYMANSLKKYGGDYKLALASYNGGHGGADYIRRHPEYVANPDYNAPFKDWKHQTGDYVKTILTRAGKMDGAKFNDTGMADTKPTQAMSISEIKAAVENPEAFLDAQTARLQANYNKLQANINTLNEQLNKPKEPDFFAQQFRQGLDNLAKIDTANEYEKNNIVPKSGGFWNDMVSSVKSGMEYYGRNPDDFIVDTLATGLRFAGGAAGGALAVGSGGLGIVGGMGIAAGASYLGDWMSSAVRGQNFDIRKADHFGAAMNAVGIGAFGVGTKLLRSGVNSGLGKLAISGLTGATDEAASLAYKVGTGIVSNVAQSAGGSAVAGREYTTMDFATDALFGSAFEVGGHFMETRSGNLSKTLSSAQATKNMSQFENMAGNPIIRPTNAIPDVLLGDITAKAFAGQEVAAKMPELNLMTPETLNATLKDTQIQQTNLSILLDNPKLAKEVERYAKLETDLGTQKLKVDNLPEGSEGQLKAISDYEKQLTKLEEVKSGIFGKYENTYGISKEDHSQLLKRQIADIPNISSEKGKASLGGAVADARKTRDTLQTFKDGNEAIERLALNDMVSQQPKWINGNKMSETALNLRDGAAKTLVEKFNKLEPSKRSSGLREVINQVTSLEGLKTTNAERLDRYFASIDPEHPNHKKEYNLRNLATWATKEAKRPNRKDAMEQQLKEMGAAYRFANNSFEGQTIPEEFVPTLKEVLGDSFVAAPNGDGTASFQWNNYDPYAEKVSAPNTVETIRNNVHNKLIVDLTPNAALMQGDIHPTTKEITQYEFMMQAKGIEGYEEALEMGLDGRPVNKFPTAADFQRDRELSELRSLDRSEVVMSREIASTSKKIQDVFSLSKAEADNTAVVVDSVFKEIAKRENKELNQVYSDIMFKKSTLEEIMNVPKNQKLFQFVNAQKIDKMMKSRLKVAEKLEAKGASQEEIFMATYWQKDQFDNKWYYDMSAEYKPTAKFGDLWSQASLQGVKPEDFNAIDLTIGDVLDYDNLYQLYPDIKDVKFRITDDADYRWNGAYDANNDEIWLNKSRLKDINTATDTLHHELQHALQKRMGITADRVGASEKLNDFIKKNPNATQLEIERQRKLIYSSEWIELQARNAGANHALRQKGDDLVFSSKMYQDMDMMFKGITEVWGKNVKEADLASIGQIGALQDMSIAYNESPEVLFAKNVRGVPKGAMQTLENGKNIIHALTNPDISTPLHEVAHVYEKVLTNAERSVVLEWAKPKKSAELENSIKSTQKQLQTAKENANKAINLVGGEMLNGKTKEQWDAEVKSISDKIESLKSTKPSWTRETSERFAEGFEQYQKNGVAPKGSGLDKLFHNFKNFMKDIYIGLTGRVTLNDGIKKIYAQMVSNVDINSMQAIRKEFLIEKYNLDKTKPLNPQIDRMVAIAKSENELARSAVAYSKMTGLQVDRLGSVKLGEGGLTHKKHKSWFGLLQTAHDMTNDIFSKLDPNSVDPLTGSFNNFTDHYNFNENYHRKVKNALGKAFPNKMFKIKFEDLTDKHLDALAYTLSYEDSLKTIDKVSAAFNEVGRKADHMQMRYDMLETQRTNYMLYKNNPEAIKKALGKNADDIAKYVDTMAHTTPNHRFFRSFREEAENLRIYMEGAEISPMDKFLYQMTNKVIGDVYFDKYYKTPVTDFLDGLGIGETKDHHIGGFGQISRAVVQLANSTVLTSTPLNATQAYMEGHGNLRSAFYDAAETYGVNTAKELDDFALNFLKQRGYLKMSDRLVSAIMTSSLENNMVRTATQVPQLGKLSKTKLGEPVANSFGTIYKISDFINGSPFRLASVAIDDEMAKMSAKIAQGIFKNGEYKDMDAFESIYDSIYAQLQTKSLNTSRNLLSSKIVGQNWAAKAIDLPSIQKAVDSVITIPEKWLHDIETNTNTLPVVAGGAKLTREGISAVARGAEAATFQFSGFISESAAKHFDYLKNMGSRAVAGKLTNEQMLNEFTRGVVFAGTLTANGTLVGGTLNALLSIINQATKEDATSEGKLQGILNAMDSFNFYRLVFQDSGVGLDKLSLNQLENTSMIVNNFLQVLSIPVELTSGEFKDRGILKSRAKDLTMAGEKLTALLNMSDAGDVKKEFAEVIEATSKLFFTGVTSNVRAVTAQSKGYAKIRSNESIYDVINNGSNSEYYMTAEDSDKMRSNAVYGLYKQALAMAGLRDKNLQEINDQWQTASSISVREGDIIGAVKNVVPSVLGTDKE